MALAAPDLPADVRAALPTFFIVGAPKAGTTSLHEYLAEHPQIAMTTVKECMCFEPVDWVERLGDYRTLFPELRPVRGESSTAYSSYPWAPDVPDRIQATVPDAKVVYVVRDPIARTLSHYAQNVWDGLPVRPFDELMDDLEDPMNMPVWCSRYATQLERWVSRLGAERVLVLDARELRDERPAVLRRVFAFLDVDASFVSPEWEHEHNAATSHRVPGPVGRRAPSLLEVPVLRSLLTREVPTPQLRPDQRARLETLLGPEADGLRAMTGLSFSHWSI